MQEPLATGAPTLNAPSFYLTGRQPLRPSAIVLATVGAFAVLCSVLLALGHTGQAHSGSGSGGRSAGAARAGEEKDDPDQVDTIVLGDPADAPVPGRRGDHVSAVHPTILVHLPRYGETVGLIPDTPAGHLLYGWLASFNKANEAGLGSMLPEVAVAGQMALRRETGGFELLSAKEVRPGVMVFRLRDQTVAGGEVLGTLVLGEGVGAAGIGSLSLRGVLRGSTANAGSLRE